MVRGKLRVGVLRGGPSGEYEVSMRTGKYVLDQLKKKKDLFDPIDIWISRDGTWHVGGFEMSPEVALSRIDCAFIALHGQYGEDGQVQKLFEREKIPFTGSGSMSSALGMHKHISKDILKREGLSTPLHIVLDPKTDAVELAVDKIAAQFPFPMVVKPTSSGSSLGISLVNTPESLGEAVEFALQHSEKILIEEFIEGREATCGVIDDFRGEEIYACVPVEIVKPEQNEFFDYDAKYSGRTEEISPGRFSEEEKRIMQDMAQQAHRAHGLRHYSRSDFLITSDDILILEVNTLPGLTEESLFPKSLTSLGVRHEDFIEHLIHLALRKS